MLLDRDIPGSDQTITLIRTPTKSWCVNIGLVLSYGGSVLYSNRCMGGIYYFILQYYILYCTLQLHHLL